MALETSEAARRRLLADAFERVPALGLALDAARGVCENFQGTHPSGRRCKRGDKCPMLHVKPGQDLSLASNRLHAPFVHMTRDGKLLLMPLPPSPSSVPFPHTPRHSASSAEKATAKSSNRTDPARPCGIPSGPGVAVTPMPGVPLSVELSRGIAVSLLSVHVHTVEPPLSGVPI